MKLKDLKTWWQVKTGRYETPFDGDVPFWLVSLCFHLVLLVLLAKLLLPVQTDRLMRINLDHDLQLVDLQNPPTVEFSELLMEDLGHESVDDLEVAIDQAIVIELTPEKSVDEQTPEADWGEIFSDLTFVQPTAENQAVIPLVGSVGNVATGASGAIDQLTQNILNSLQEQPTLVVWLFDQSASMISQRAEIQRRFEKIYQEVSVLQEAGHSAFTGYTDVTPLLTQVYGFGIGVEKLLDEPSDDLQLIVKAIEGIQRDDTGIENALQAVITAANDQSRYRRGNRSPGGVERKIMLIVVSDEASDDSHLIEEAIKTCLRWQISVSVIGVPAPFGRAETMLKWVDPDPDYDQREQWAIVSQGPESIMPERLRMDLTGDFEDLEMIDSGFGPFYLTRLCYETGGTFFAIHPNRRINRRVAASETAVYTAHLRYFFDPEVMRHYRPDYVSDQTYLKKVQANASRQALVQAAAFTATGKLESPRLRFPKLDEARFVNDVTMAQRTAAIVEPQINRVYEMLRTGEQDRDKETSLRWKAGFDLAMGQAIAAKLRAESYNAMLAMAKTRLKFDPPPDQNTPQNNTWVLRPADNIETGSQAQKLMERGKMYLKRVVEEHPGTPWALLAGRELSIPMGWEWHQDYTPPPPPPQNRPNPNNNNNQPPNPQPRENEMPRALRPPPRL
jgi:hypothetical protein